VGTYPVGPEPFGITFDGTHIWVTNIVGDSVTELNASDGSLVGTYPVGSYPYGITFGGSHIWVANSNGSTVTEIDDPQS
jgi:DNA-binding beta-propeller fold protein YncE